MAKYQVKVKHVDFEKFEHISLEPTEIAYGRIDENHYRLQLAKWRRNRWPKMLHGHCKKNPDR